MGVGTGLFMYDASQKKFMFAISSPDEFLSCFPLSHSLPYAVKRYSVYLQFISLFAH